MKGLASAGPFFVLPTDADAGAMRREEHGLPLERGVATAEPAAAKVEPPPRH
jgi:hypothetical protein